ncbi:glycosyl hydrolase [Weizmannia acidilactici]|uniref:glycoside hydrolase family 65 protein n=1 Tax=Weizmannia acidilactici TaxID=2607726 RepID=UPI00124D5D7A|nr:glycosyl hydrolase family 65 protein [Weizmannia acidilactici]GER67126.1 glycosyl hydrolase [Weizmannia acidilactici]
MAWEIIKKEFNKQNLLVNESLFALGNGYLGVRGNFEEGYSKGEPSIRGTYINAFHDITEIQYGEKAYGFPETQQKMLNIIDAQTIQIYLGEEKEHFSLFEGKVLSFCQTLHMDRGFSERAVHWRSPSGKEIKLTFSRLVSFVQRELFAIELSLEPVNFSGPVRIVSTVNGDVENYVNKNDPRIASGDAKRLAVTEAKQIGDYSVVSTRAFVSGLETACAASHTVSVPCECRFEAAEKQVRAIIDFRLDQPVNVTKFNIYTDTLRHHGNVAEKAAAIQESVKGKDFSFFLKEQERYLSEYWKAADVEISGDPKLQEGIRFNLYQLLQFVGKDSASNIAAKGLSGEGYEGHYFWDTEIYIFPVFLLTRPDIARNLLLYRYNILDHARARAKEMGHKKGALFPWRTISGTECSAYFPAGTAQYHISADIAYSYVQYFYATHDEVFMRQYGVEVLAETARLWLETGHYNRDGKFVIEDVTGPDEYTAIVNNNYYTNVMAKFNLKSAHHFYHWLKTTDPAYFTELCDRIGLLGEEAAEWQKAGDAMYLPYDAKLGIHKQDDSFLEKAVWDFEHTPKDHYPLLLHYHPLTIYRYQVCKQADTVLAHFLLEDEADPETIRNSYHYYEKVTTHDSSLSSCIFSIMASKLGEAEKAYHYFIETALLDLDNTHGNTKDGLHMANMGGTWMSIVYGFAGVRIKESGLSVDPSIPEQWERYAFRLTYQNRKLQIEVTRGSVTVVLTEGEALRIRLFGREETLLPGKVVARAIHH